MSPGASVCVCVCVCVNVRVCVCVCECACLHAQGIVCTDKILRIAIILIIIIVASIICKAAQDIMLMMCKPV